MRIAYNLTRLVLLELEHGIDVDFTEGVENLRSKRWVDLNELRK